MSFNILYCTVCAPVPQSNPVISTQNPFKSSQLHWHWSFVSAMLSNKEHLCSFPFDIQQDTAERHNKGVHVWKGYRMSYNVSMLLYSRNFQPKPNTTENVNIHKTSWSQGVMWNHASYAIRLSAWILEAIETGNRTEELRKTDSLMGQAFGEDARLWS